MTAPCGRRSGFGISNSSRPRRPGPSLCRQCGKSGVTCAAFGNIAEGSYTVHMVNNGPTRPAMVAGLPTGLKELRMWVTDRKRGMEEMGRIRVEDGKAQFTIDTMSFTTLIGTL